MWGILINHYKDPYFTTGTFLWFNCLDNLQPLPNFTVIPFFGEEVVVYQHPPTGGVVKPKELLNGTPFIWQPLKGPGLLDVPFFAVCNTVGLCSGS